MSLLLVGGPGSPRWSGVADELIDRLLTADDQVRVVLGDDGDAELIDALRSRRVHVAFGDASNADLMERAAQGCRSIILFEPTAELLSKAVEAAGFARVERLIVCARGARRGGPLEGANLSYVWLAGRPKGVLRSGIAWGDYAAAIDAADDLAGEVTLDLDLDTQEAWSKLGVRLPDRPRGSSRPA